MADPMVILASYCCCYFAAEGYTGEGGIADVVIILFVVVHQPCVAWSGRQRLRKLLLLQRMSAAQNQGYQRHVVLRQFASTELVVGDMS